MALRGIFPLLPDGIFAGQAVSPLFSLFFSPFAGLVDDS